MKRRRYLTFSLRTLFVLLTVLAVWLGVVVNRAREQREAVKAIEALGGFVFYDWQNARPATDEPAGPIWLRRTIGDDCFQEAYAVNLSDLTTAHIRKAMPLINRLRNLKEVWFWGGEEERPNTHRAALPEYTLVFDHECTRSRYPPIRP